MIKLIPYVQAIMEEALGISFRRAAVLPEDICLP